MFKAKQVDATRGSIVRLCHLEGALRVRIQRIRFHFQSFLQLMRFGVPLALQTLIYPLANLQIASAINSHGVACMAGNSAAQTVEQMVTAFRNAFGLATATFMGQNLGAEKPDRVKKSFWHSLWLVIVVNTTVCMLVMLTNSYWFKLFLKDDMVAMEYGILRNNMMMVANIFAALNAIFARAIQAFGYPVFGTINVVAWVLGLRAVWMAFVYPLALTYASLIMCFGVSWALTALCDGVILAVLYRRYKKGKYKRI